MSWGWGALIGAGAALIAAPFTGGLSLMSIPVMAGAGAAAGAGIGAIAGKVIKKFGDTPKNELKQVGVDPKKLYEESKEHRQNRQRFLDKKNEESKRKIEDKTKKLESLDESIKSLAAEIKKMPEGPEKAQKLAQVESKKEQKKKLEKEISEEESLVKEREDKIDKIFQELGDPVNYSPQQYSENANTPRWKSWKNWGIGIAAVIILFMLIGFLKKLFSSVLNSIKG